MSSTSAGIIIKPKNFFTNWPLFQMLDVPNIQDDYVMRLSKSILQLMQQNTPVKTGKLRGSETITIKFKSGGGIDRRYNISIGPQENYAMFPEAGAKASVGRFVAAIQKRVKTGTHPGQQPQWYIKRTYDTMNSKLPVSLAIDLTPKIQAAWNKRLNS